MEQSPSWQADSLSASQEILWPYGTWRSIKARHGIQSSNQTLFLTLQSRSSSK
jgi:hypothetical protein